MPGETVVLKAHQHWITRVKLISLGLALVILVGLADYLLTAVRQEYRLIAILVALGILGLIAIVSWIQWGSRTFTITDRRVILDAGVFSRTSKVIALDRVQDISLSQSLLGRILGYGKVEIDSAGAAGAEILAAIPRPQRFRDEVFVRAEKMRAADAEPGTDETPAPQPT